MGIEKNMKIWKLSFELDKYDNLKPKPWWNGEQIKSFDGRGQYGNWSVTEIERLEPEKGLPLSNAPGFFSHIPVFDEKAVIVLKRFIDGNAEILPLKSDEGAFYAINVTNVLDGINYDKSQYKTYPNSNKIMRFIQYSFIKDKVLNQDLFKFIQELLKNVFVSDDFRNTVMRNGLTGFKFDLLWESE